jgi:hypothetical protein
MIPMGPRKVIVLGMMSRMPVAGVVWQTVHYLEGFRRLGLEPYYVEAHSRTPAMLMKSKEGDGTPEAVAFISRVMDRFDLAGRWAFHALHSDGRVYGMSRERLLDLYASSELIINLHGGTTPLEEHSRTGRLIFVETDPVEVQVQLHDDNPKAIRFLEPHAAFFTFGELYGTPECRLPVSPRFEFRPTRQPVVPDFWNTGIEPGDAFTTIGNWRQAWRRVRLDGEFYDWSKHSEFMRFLGVPARTGQSFEVALSSCSDEDRELLRGKGWSVRDGLSVSTDPDVYRSYIGGSRGEFTVAKDQNVRLRTGWFSDRSATYLAAGRPVITQETGFSLCLPTGQGLFGFSTMDDVADAVERILSSPRTHSNAAREIGREYFSHEVVLAGLLSETGVMVA